MIRQTTTVPVVAPPGADESLRGVGKWMFVGLEVVLLAAIPLLGILGFRSLLSTQSGEFVVDPGPNDAGWIAAIEPSPLSILVDVDEGVVGGAVLLAPSGDEVSGGTVILISGATVVEGRPLSERSPADLVRVLERSLRLAIGEPVVADADAWDILLDGRSIELANPDPVVAREVVEGEDPAVIIPAGRVTIAAGDLAAMSTRPPIGSADLEALEFRRDVLWNALVEDEAVFADGAIESDDGDLGLREVAQHLQSIASGVHRIEALPLDGGTIDVEAAEALVRRSIALPLGHEVGARLQVRIIDRTGTNDLEAAAQNLGRAGFEVVQVANAFAFDDGPTQLLVTLAADENEIARLADLTSAATVPPSLDAEATSTVTLLLGSEASIAQSAE